MAAKTITIVEPPGTASVESWWSRYHAALEAAGLTASATKVVDVDAEYIVANGILGAGDPSSEEHTWPHSRLRKGLVIGSVQSGKTASMLAVTAKAVDRGVDIVVMLTGTRVALWRQTVDRALDQLDGWSEENASLNRSRRVLLPPPRLVLRAGHAPLSDLYHVHPNIVRRHLRKGTPLIAMVMKQSDHLMRFGNYLRETLDSTLPNLGRPLHLLVIDDEADDGSILDAVVEAGLEAETELLKQVPRHIARIWASDNNYHTTANKSLYATYMAYTATPQANILQSEHNPLSPTDFVVSLRTPYNHGEIESPRSITFKEPGGLKRYYCGGEFFYNNLDEGVTGLCVPSKFPTPDDYDTDEGFRDAVATQQSELLGDALRAFFVGSAMRLALSSRSLSAARELGAASLEAVGGASPHPSTMLVHPSAAIQDQLEMGWVISRWSGAFVSPELTDGADDRDQERPSLDPVGLGVRLEAEEELWQKWYLAYQETRDQLAEAYQGHGYAPNSDLDWDSVKKSLLEEVFPNARIRVVNSDPMADDRPIFSPIRSGDNDLYEAAPDLMSILVSGNVMARGITLEGLITTLFLRDSDSPAADTQMQMQRWFGYRGSYLFWCRVFLYEDQLDLFRAYHENDSALRQEVLTEMNALVSRAPKPLVLQGARFRATGKIANLRALPLCPGPNPFVRVVERGDHTSENLDRLADLLDEEGWTELSAANTVRGLLWERKLSFLETARLLESLRYSNHRPDPNGPNHRRWGGLAAELRLDGGKAPLFRPPAFTAPGRDVVSPQGCPYSIAAYLRLWEAVLSQKARGLYPTDDYRTPWSMINLSDYAQTAPKFNIGVRFGSAGVAVHGRLAKKGVMRMDRQIEGDVIVSTWGSRNPGSGVDAYLGDSLFDYHHTKDVAPNWPVNEPAWRPRGHDGLVLFHVIKTDDGETLTVGMALPLGGPDHFAAVPPPYAGRTDAEDV